MVEVFPSSRLFVAVLIAVVRRPDWLSNEKAHRSQPAFVVCGEAMIDSGGQHDQVAPFHRNTDPVLVRVPDVKVPAAVQNETDFVIGV